MEVWAFLTKLINALVEFPPPPNPLFPSFFPGSSEIKETLSFNYGQKHATEVEFAKKIMQNFSEKYSKVNHQIVDMSGIGLLISKVDILLVVTSN